MNADLIGGEMREDMNPLDLLADVAVSCSSDKHDEKLQHCDEIVEPEEEFNKPIESSLGTELPDVGMTNNNTIILSDSQPVDGGEASATVGSPLEELTAEQMATELKRSSLAWTHSEDQLVPSETTEIRDTQAILNGISQSRPQSFNGSRHSYHETPDYDSSNMETPTNSDKKADHSLSHNEQSSVKDQSLPTSLITEGEHSRETDTVRVSEHDYLPKNSSLTKPAPVLTAVTLSQRVTRLLSPNFKLTMTDAIPQVLDKRKVSSLLLGNMGSAAMRNALSPTVKSRLVSSKPQTTFRSYPNISMSVIPTDFPLLDHDYCYQNYCDIAQAATKLQKRLNAEKKAAAKSAALKLAETSEYGKLPKRKYRTKRIIAEEYENARKAALQQKADDGDLQAQLEITDIDDQIEKKILRKEIKEKRKAVKKSQGMVEIDSEEEAMREFAGDIDNTNPVLDHDPSFQDQFIYFGSKKHKSKRRNAKMVDPYESFWKTGQLNAGQPGASSQTAESAISGGSSGSSSALPVDVMLNTNQEINDVLDILGISGAHEGAELLEVDGKPDELELSNSQQATADTITEAISDPPLFEVSHISSDICIQPSNHGDPTATLPSAEIFSENVTDVGEMPHCEVEACGPATEIACGPATEIACAPAPDDGLDDLFQGITMDQVSELILALEVEPRSGDKTREYPPTKTTEQIKAVSSSTDYEIKTLAALSKDACKVSGLEIPSESDSELHLDSDTPALSQQSRVSNISLDITEADLLSSDRNLNLDILSDLSATPTKSSRPTSPFQTPSSVTISPCRQAESPEAVSVGLPDARVEEPVPDQSPVVVPVTMYWNTFPALLLDGVKYVRLIDISRQALPSKETGLLKKRAQTLGYDVITCTDLQRNLLVRYAFANHSRSNLMVCEAGAAEVIASYMEKSEMEELSKAPDLPSQQLPADVTSVTTTTVRAPAEPVTLMPQVLIEHKPLQQSSSTNGKKTPTTEQQEPVAPERSSRLRQIKSSYRRFLSLSSTTASTPSTVKADAAVGANSGVEENASDRGYHSDQSPDSLLDKPIQAKKHRNTSNSKPGSPPVAAGKKLKSVRRSLASSQVLSPPASAMKEFHDRLEEVPRSVIGMGNALPMATEPWVTVDVHTDIDVTVPSHQPSDTATSIDSTPTVPQPSDTRLHNSQASIQISEPLLNMGAKSDIVLMRHVDLLQRRSGLLQRSQDGKLYLEFFKSLHSPCIECCTCRQFYGLKAFTKHQHQNRRLVPVKVRQRVEPRGYSVDSESWQAFKRQKRLFEGTRSPLKKINETKLSGPPHTLEQLPESRSNPICAPQLLGKRIPKQKKFNPDELYYINPYIMNITAKKRKAEIDLSLHPKRHLSDSMPTVQNLLER